jgi:hypothetical protein
MFFQEMPENAVTDAGKHVPSNPDQYHPSPLMVLCAAAVCYLGAWSSGRCCCTCPQLDSHMQVRSVSCQFEIQKNMLSPTYHTARNTFTGCRVAEQGVLLTPICPAMFYTLRAEV